MKKSTQISGLPIISILDGNQVGKVKSLVINPDKGSVDFLTIEHEDFQVSVKAIPFKKVVGIGEYAVTVDSESAVIDLNEIPIANQLVNKKIKITNTKVMTRKGELIGEIVEYFVDQDTGHILGMELKVADKEVALSSESVVTFGKDIVIVKEDAASYFLNSVEELEGKVEDEETIPVIQEGQSLEDEEVKALKYKQIQLLNGKKATKNILDKNGNVLIFEGTVLTTDLIEKAQEEGPSIVVELSMNVEA
ncbi:PRC-barrel domain-containing protein [Cytobacillus sp. FJAT-54145]|uniref:PRC-barrel domain-containing protein n=1 Tax=Cytobacillus spartinae TaxID=3299023 RepID=A0ABW6KGX7_9BACI